MTKLRDPRSATAGLLLGALLGLPFLAGCAVHAHPGPHPPHGAVRVTIAKGHFHSAGCGHYRHHGRWYHARGHVHGPRCGHAFVRGVWVLKR